jgi:chromosome segregation ATPase
MAQQSLPFIIAESIARLSFPVHLFVETSNDNSEELAQTLQEATESVVQAYAKLNEALPRHSRAKPNPSEQGLAESQEGDFKASVQHLSEQSTKLKLLSTKLASVVKSAETSTSDANSERLRYEDICTKKSKQIKRLKEQVAKASTEHDSQIKTKVNEVAHLSAALKEARTLTQIQDNSLSEANAKLERTTARLQAREQEFAEASKKIESAEAVARENARLKETFAKQRHQDATQLKTFSQQVASLQAQLKAAHAKITEQDREVKASHSKTAEQDRELKELRSRTGQQEESKAQTDNLSRQLKEAEAKRSKLAAELEKLKSRSQSELSDQVQEVKRLKANIAESKASAAELLEQIKQLQRSLESATGEVNTLKLEETRRHTKQADNETSKRLAEALAESQAECEGLKGLLSTHTQQVESASQGDEVGRLRAQVEELILKLNVYNLSRVAQETALAAVEAEARTTLQQKESLAGQLSEATEELSQLKSQIESEQAKAKAFEQTSEALQGQLSGQLKKTEALEADIEAFKVTVSELQTKASEGSLGADEVAQQLDVSRTEAREQANKLEGLMSTLTLTEANLKTAQAETTGLRQQLDDKQTQLEEATSKLTNVQAEGVKTQSLLSASNEQLESLNLQVSQKQQELEVLATTKEETAADLLSVRSELASVLQRLESELAKVKALEEEKVELSQQLENLSSSRGSASKLSDDAKDVKIQALEYQIEALKHTAEDSRAILRELEESNHSLTAQLAEARSQTSSQSGGGDDRVRVLEEEIEELKTKLEDAKEYQKEFERDITRQKKQTQTQKDKVQECEQAIEELHRQLDEANSKLKEAVQKNAEYEAAS